MNLITRDYKLYKIQLKVKNILIIIILFCCIYLTYLSCSYLRNKNIIKNYANLDNQIIKVQNDIDNVDKNILMLDTEIAKLDKLLIMEEPIGDSSKTFHASNIMYNILESLNDGIKLYNVLFIDSQMEVTGIANKIDELSSYVYNLEKYYNVQINKTQQINHNEDGIYYAFNIILKEKGE